MARTTGPLLSLGASGSVAKTMTFSVWKGRPYVRQLVTPANPKSPGQVNTRMMMAFLSQAWKEIGAAYQATWQALASATNVSPFNAYVQFNLKNWTQKAPPTQSYPAPMSDTPDVWSVPTAAAGVRQAVITSTPASNGAPWGLVVLLSPATGPLAGQNTNGLIYDTTSAPGGVPLSIVVTGLQSGLGYNFSVQDFTPDGVMGALQSGITTVTPL